jgi:hypothetical protein
MHDMARGGARAVMEAAPERLPGEELVMHHHPLCSRRIAAVVFGAWVLTSQAVWALEASAARSEPRPTAYIATAALSDPIGQMWQFVLQLLAPEGCTIDPDGHNRCQAPARHRSGKGVLPPGDNGCSIDPNGRIRCAAPARHRSGKGVLPSGDNGCSIDPDGRPHCNP